MIEFFLSNERLVTGNIKDHVGNPLNIEFLLYNEDENDWFKNVFVTGPGYQIAQIFIESIFLSEGIYTNKLGTVIVKFGISTIGARLPAKS